MFSTNPIYDHIEIRLKAEAVEGGFTEAICTRVMDVLERGHEKPKHYEGENYYQGYLGNLRVTLFSYKLTVKGSLWLYWKGNQLETMDLVEAQQAIAQLSSILGLPLEKAEVKKFEISANMEMDFKPATYYPYLGKAGRYKRIEQNNELYYRIGINEMLFYDKIKEMKNRDKQQVPEEYKRLNILRFELAYKKELDEQFNTKFIIVGTLLEEGFYEKACEKWANAYFSIQKDRTIGSLLQAVTNVKSLLKYLAFAGVKAIGGVYKLHQIIKQGELEDRWSTQVYNSLSKKLNDIAEDPQTTITHPLIEELDRKIKKAAQWQHRTNKNILTELLPMLKYKP